MGYYLHIILIAVLVPFVQSEVFSALATLTKALHHEKELASKLREYVNLEKERLDDVLK